MPESSLMVLIGTKAQYIKTAPILRELDQQGVPYRLIYTGQHNETFDILEAAFGARGPDDILVPDFEAATHISFLSWCLRYWLAVSKRLVGGAWRDTRIGLVHGDTASTLFGAMAVRFAGGKVGHIEAGLRSSQLFDPFPEEVIRRLVSRLSTLHFAPDNHAKSNLKGVPGTVVDTGGNTLRDALKMALGSIGGIPAVGGLGGFAVVSIHRRENLSHRADLDLLMEEVVRTTKHLPVKFVLHPATREKIRSSGWYSRLQSHPNLELLGRMDYPDFVRLLVSSRMLMTDGGSNQEEAAMLGLPTLLLRRTTERPDGLDDNVSLSGLEREVIRKFVALHGSATWPLRVVDGDSPSAKIVEALQADLHERA